MAGVQRGAHETIRDFFPHSDTKRVVAQKLEASCRAPKYTRGHETEGRWIVLSMATTDTTARAVAAGARANDFYACRRYRAPSYAIPDRLDSSARTAPDPADCALVTWDQSTSPVR